MAYQVGCPTSCCHFRLSSDMIAYAFRQLAKRAGLAYDAGPRDTGFETLGIGMHYAASDRVHPGQHDIVIVPSGTGAWERLLGRIDHTRQWIPTARCVPNGAHLPFSDRVPVLFWGDGYEDGRKPFAERREDGAVVFYVDIVAATLFMLSRWEETVVAVRDAHDRFPATASAAYRQGFLDRPIIDEYALILQAWLKVLLPGWEPNAARFSVKLSHDIDKVRSHPGLYHTGRACAGDLVKRRSLRRASRTLLAYLRPERDPLYNGVFELADLSERCGFRSAFYFMGAKRGPYDPGYAPSSVPIKHCIAGLANRGHEIGFHAGYHTLYDAERFEWEISRVQSAARRDKMGGRQHYLRFRVPNTWRMWEQAGLAYDSTLSYADYEGFRCGTCWPFRPFDIERGRELDLIEIPLIVMDGTLRQYRGLTPEQGQERILMLADRCRQVNGVFTLLWHNSSFEGEWELWAAMYRRTLPMLAEMLLSGESEALRQ